MVWWIKQQFAYEALSTYLNGSSPGYLVETSGLGSASTSLSRRRARDFCTSLQYGEWKMKASALCRVKRPCALPTVKRNGYVLTCAVWV